MDPTPEPTPAPQPPYQGSDSSNALPATGDSPFAGLAIALAAVSAAVVAIAARRRILS
ncbi:MAG: LPXTG cell wall anchor domain-containing protein [Eggerthellaceae bacterium]|nr:LPXTG cell wall anchor domain-containing protein [Eggerthellaceae bacterium]